MQDRIDPWTTDTAPVCSLENVLPSNITTCRHAVKIKDLGLLDEEDMLHNVISGGLVYCHYCVAVSLFQLAGPIVGEGESGRGC
jgi:hypothetical protein